ncbi:TetR/AcrR family transcriptional regulator [Curtobacterium sp. MCBA15_001]|uniref:TetR/AcrR family transcriptional regulator n=1 Tax=Curtobacterium sp. MCBA15_001 TaxID=1898731 RepID=UPI0008DC86A8|nr:TetR/AcrR family transcriptional regulator [Curtobacterium sp. MCBA15_001]OIH94323.1 TetR family transcriptional regulator [Curtobacterium sp. MCBA15_001]
MARWQPGTRDRLQAVSLQLFAEHGFEQTTVAEIAAAAEVTERTFFRHFADKREVLFAGQDDFVALFTDPIDQAPADTPPFDLVARALQHTGAFFADDRRAWSRLRQPIIEAEPSLRERELGKLAMATVRIGEVLRARGVPEPAATLAAETGITVFHLSFQQWIAPGETRSMEAITHERLSALTELVHPGH